MKFAFTAISLIVTLAACTTKTQPIPATSQTPMASETITASVAPTSSPSAKIGESSVQLTETLTENTFTIKYPKDMTLDQSQNNPPRIYKSGPTQKGQTEMYDGLIITFETVSNDAKKTLTEYVKEKTEIDPNHSEIIAKPSETKLNNYVAIKYRSRGLGEYDSYVLQTLDKTGFIYITVLAEDPTKVGFQKLSLDILNTITLMK